MIRVQVLRGPGRIVKLSATGHAGQGEFGLQVCACRRIIFFRAMATMLKQQEQLDLGNSKLMAPKRAAAAGELVALGLGVLQDIAPDHIMVRVRRNGRACKQPCRAKAIQTEQPLQCSGGGSYEQEARRQRKGVYPPQG